MCIQSRVLALVCKERERRERIRERDKANDDKISSALDVERLAVKCSQHAHERANTSTDTYKIVQLFCS